MIFNYFIENLNNLMSKRGIDGPLELSRQLGIPQSTISNWKINKNIPKEEPLEKIALFFNVEPYYFFMEPGTQGAARPVERHDDFKTLLDDLAAKCLNEVELETYRIEGVSEYVRVLRINYESKEHILPVGWCLKLNQELLKYVSVDLMKKLQSNLSEQAAKKAKSS